MTTKRAAAQAAAAQRRNGQINPFTGKPMG
jgi:hypothetical protein